MGARLRDLVWLGAIALALLGACAAPTLPLPPPDAAVGAPNEEGIVEVQGSGAEAGALALCVNRDTDAVAGAYADDVGHFAISIPAEIGHELEVWYEVGFDKSQPLTVVVPAE